MKTQDTAQFAVLNPESDFYKLILSMCSREQLESIVTHGAVQESQFMYNEDINRLYSDYEDTIWDIVDYCRDQYGACSIPAFLEETTKITSGDELRAYFLHTAIQTIARAETGVE